MNRPWVPGIIFALQAILLAAAMSASGRFAPEVVPDTRGYVEYPFDSVTTALEHYRTFGYPLFLRTVALVRPTPEGVPVAHFVLHIVCVAVFWMGLRTFIASPWSSMLAASSLLYSNVVLRYTGCIAPDAVASSCSIATIGLLLLAVLRPPSIWRWLALAGSIFVTYQLRPAYLFLVPLVPLLGLALHWLLKEAASGPRKRSSLLPLVAVSLLPLVLFCTVRWLIVDHFSIVSFGGNNFAGVVTRFLDRETLTKISADVRPLAEEVLRRRQVAAKPHRFRRRRNARIL